MNRESDIREDLLLKDYPKAFTILLLDRTTGGNIYWATDSSKSYGDGYGFYDEITIEKITGEHSDLLKPRAAKSKEEQELRTKGKAEVFTPSWICNKQNNLVDAAFFDGKNPFNEELDLHDNTHTWKVITNKIPFPTVSGRSWHDYVLSNRLEITCGEAPYLTSRYDTTTGEFIDVHERIGILDRKLRVVSENISDEKNDNNVRQWKIWAVKALQATYGFEWQGDNLLLAREALFYTFIENYQAKWGMLPLPRTANRIAEVISWNIWQMDGLTGGLPGYDVSEKLYECHPMFGETPPRERLCRIMEWGTEGNKSKKEQPHGQETIFNSLRHNK